MEESETMRQISQLSLDMDLETKDCIYEIAKSYSGKTGIGISDLLMYGTDIYLLAMVRMHMCK